jgi:ribosomal-protein-alanine N-acetyltransferase
MTKLGTVGTIFDPTEIMLALDLSQFQVLRTKRLLLREPIVSDAPALFAMRSDPLAMRYVPRPIMQRVEEAEEFIATFSKDRAENNGITWAITLHGSDTLIGNIGFYRMKKEHYRAEVGYMLHPDHWGQRLVGEALDAVVQLGFHSLGFHSIEAITDVENVASNALLARHGFRQEAHFREDFFWDGRFRDTLVWSRLVSDR